MGDPPRAARSAGVAPRRDPRRSSDEPAEGDDPCVEELWIVPSGDVLAPGKVLRLATMVDAIVEELHARPADGAGRARIRLMYQDALVEVGSTLSDPLLEELARFQPTMRASSDDALRIDLALLAGWLRGLRFGLAAAAVPYELPPTPDA